MNDIAVSVIMSVADGSPGLQESINSVLEQDCENFEFIIIHDGVSEEIDQILSSYKDKRLNILPNKSNLGLTVSLNKGLDIARGKYIARLDSGDISLPHRLRLQLEHLERNQEIFLAGGNCVYIDPSGKELFTSALPQRPENINCLLAKKNVLLHSAIMFRNSDSLKYREKFFYAQDYDLYLRIVSSGKTIINLPDKLIKYRLDLGAVSFQKKIFQDLFAEKAREFYVERIRSGRDNYVNFDPVRLLNTSLPRESAASSAGRTIKNAFEACDMEEVRSKYRDYIRLRERKTPDRYSLYFLLSFFPLPLILIMRNFVSRIKSFWYRLQK